LDLYWSLRVQLGLSAQSKLVFALSCRQSPHDYDGTTAGSGPFAVLVAGGVATMQFLLIAIVTWLSINYGLPATTEVPAVRFVQPLEIAFLHYGAFTGASRQHVLDAYAVQPPSTRREVVSAYDGGHVTILLPVGWTGRTPAELSMLVHEMVHHLQATARLRYACPQEREKLAYEAQEKWLGLFNTGLEKEFAIDQLTLLVTTHCGP